MDSMWHAELRQYINVDLPDMIAVREKAAKDTTMYGPASRMCNEHEARSLREVLTDLCEIIPEDVCKA